MQDQTWPERTVVDTPAPVRVAQRLSEVMIHELILDYQSGLSGRQLAEKYGLARSTLLKLVRERGVAVRHARLSAEGERRCLVQCLVLPLARPTE